MSVGERLTEVVQEYGLPQAVVDRFANLLAALAAEPDPHTAVWRPEQAVDHHIADSLCALRIEAVREAASLGDIGSGAGFPGLPLAAALPAARIDLIESARRKCAVIERLAEAAGVPNARA